VFVCILPAKAVAEMTYAVSGGTLNPTHSLTQQSSETSRLSNMFLHHVASLACFQVRF